MKRRAQPPIALEIRFDSAATPARVAATARFVDEILKGADPDLPDGSVTLLVSNYATVAGIRAWDLPGRAAVRRCERYLTNPIGYILPRCTSRKPSPKPALTWRPMRHV